MAEYIKEKNLDDMIVVSPDLGGVSRARNMAERLNCVWLLLISVVLNRA